MEKMLKIFTLLCITTPIFCQDGMEPDVTFGEQNDRFDINDMVQHSKAYFNDEPNYHRSKIENSMRVDDDTLLEAIPERRKNYANNDKIDPVKDEARAFYDALKKAYEQNNKKTRRNTLRVESSARKSDDSLQGAFPARRQDYAYHDKMQPDKDEDRADYEANLKTFAENSKKTRRNKPRIASRVKSDDGTPQAAIPKRRQISANHDKINPDKGGAESSVHAQKINQTRRNTPRIISKVGVNYNTLQGDIPETRKNYADRNQILTGNEKANKKISFQSIIDDLHAGKIYGSRRNDAKPFLDPELEIMLHHAVPINAKFHGYLTAPLVD